jgi:hypothetical protein
MLTALRNYDGRRFDRAAAGQFVLTEEHRFRFTASALNIGRKTGAPATQFASFFHREGLTI